MNVTHIRDRKEFIPFLIDLVMILLLILNLSFIVFDWMFTNLWFQNLVASASIDFYEFYQDQIHPNFLMYDLIFIGIFLTEFIIRWINAIRTKRYHRWFFYPFIHWYDLLGLIPVGSLRFLRLLRIVGILHRLHRLEVVDLTDNPVFDFFTRYSNILVDEVTDRVVLKILNNIKSEVQEGTPMIDQVIEEVVRPQQEQLVEWLSWRVRKVAGHNLDAYKEQINTYVDRRIRYAVANNNEISKLEQIPFLGTYFTETLEKAISGIVYDVIRGTIQDLASVDNRLMLREISDVFFDDILRDDSDRQLNLVVSNIISQCLDIIIEKVKVQQWKLDDTPTKKKVDADPEQEGKLQERLREQL